MTWNDPPLAGEVWRRRGPPQETRHVIDRECGGHVHYYDGNWRRRYRGRCSEEEWHAWAARAKRIE